MTAPKPPQPPNPLFRPFRAVLGAWRLRQWHQVDEPRQPVLLDLDLVRALHLQPGMAIRNPHGQAPWVLDLLEVSRPDADLMVTLVAMQGLVRVALDWPLELYTPTITDLEAVLLMDENERLLDET